MAETVIGGQALMRRLQAISNAQAGEATMKLAATVTRGEMILTMRAVGARKTGTTAGSIQVRAVTATSAEIWGSQVLDWIDQGTGIYGPRHHVITPVVAKALAFSRGTFGPKGSLRLTGRARSGAAGAGASMVVVKSVKGMKPRPFITRSIAQAGKKVGVQLEGEIISRWNAAA